MDGLGEDEFCRSVTEVSGSGSTISETLEIVSSARRMFNLGTFMNCTVQQAIEVIRLC